MWRAWTQTSECLGPRLVHSHTSQFKYETMVEQEEGVCLRLDVSLALRKDFIYTHTISTLQTSVNY